MKHEITRADLLPLSVYEKERKERRKKMAALKAHRRMEVGPFATFYFENYDTMLHQVHEMLFIEKGGEEQLAGELAAYNPLIPQGSELVATLMFEIDDPIRRARVLGTLGGVEHTAFIRIGDAKIDSSVSTELDRLEAIGSGHRRSVTAPVPRPQIPRRRTQPRAPAARRQRLSGLRLANPAASTIVFPNHTLAMFTRERFSPPLRPALTFVAGWGAFLLLCAPAQHRTLVQDADAVGEQP